MLRGVLAAVTVLALTTAAARADELSVGDPAPKLEVKEFVKGDPVKALENGKVYVVEFWATWCGPCRATIPHLTELQKKHKDVVFIGVSVLEHEQDFRKVKPFVTEMGDKMDYRVAVDAVPAGKEVTDGAMAKNWMYAAAQEGIPTAFIVNTDGKIAWIGHPGEMDKPLAAVAAGTWDLKAAATEYREERARAARLRALQVKLRQAQQSRDPKAILAAIDDALKEDPKLEPNVAGVKFSLLSQTGTPDAAATYARKLIDDVFKDNAERLGAVAWTIVDPDLVKDKKPDAKLVKVALDAATKANDLEKGANADLLDTLAQAHFVNGDAAKAVEAAEKAVKLEPGNAEYKDRLATFKKALDKK
jgi:thiol-disulfide isomerase/thioredoxin